MTTDVIRFNVTLTSVTPASLPFNNVYKWTMNVLIPASPIIVCFGLISNILNIIVFLKSGVKDNVTTLLFSLSLSDLTFLILMTPIACSLVILQFERFWSWPFDYQFVSSVPYWPAYTAYDMSAFISVSLGVMRCACVAMPLKFKLVFTKRRTIIVVIALAVLAVSLRIPVLTIFRVAWRTDPITNVTSSYVAIVNRDTMSRINDIMNRGLVIWINYAIMVSCVGLLSYKLQEASRIRRSFVLNGAPESEKTAGDGLSPKDIQVIKSVVLVCVIFILSHLPFLLNSTVRLIYPKFTAAGQLINLFSIFSLVSITCAYLNASLNIFVYYNYNSKYRTVFLSLLPLKNGN